MATCPRCLGPLTEDHRCPRGPFRRATEVISTVLVGAVVGGVLVFGLVEHPADALVLAGAALGAVLASAVRQSVKF